MALAFGGGRGPDSFPETYQEFKASLSSSLEASWLLLLRGMRRGFGAFRLSGAGPGPPPPAPQGSIPYGFGTKIQLPYADTASVHGGEWF